MEDFYKQRLLSLADFLEKVPEKHFDMHYITYDKDGCLNLDKKLYEILNSGMKSINCGTAACAIGWMPGAFPDDFRWDKDGNTVDIVDREIRNFGAARIFFGITPKQVDYLFEPSCYDKENDYDPDNGEITKQEVIDRIREFANELD